MARMVREAMAAGAIGLGSSTAEAHVGENGLPVASRMADKSEFLALTRAMGESGRGLFQATIGSKTSMEDLGEIWRTSGRPVIWAAFFQRDDRPEYVPERLAITEAFHRDGVEVLPQVSCRPLTMDFTMRNPYPFEGMPVWRRVMGEPESAWLGVYGNADFRARAQGRPRREALRRLPRSMGPRPGAARDAPGAQGARRGEPGRSRPAHGEASGGRLARSGHRRRARRGVPRGPAQHGREGRGRPHRPPAHADHPVGRGGASVAHVRCRVLEHAPRQVGARARTPVRSRPRSSASPTTRRAPIASPAAAGSRPATGPTSPSSIRPPWTRCPSSGCATCPRTSRASSAARGVEWSLVNGQPVLERGQVVGAGGGRAAGPAPPHLRQLAASARLPR